MMLVVVVVVVMMMMMTTMTYITVAGTWVYMIGSKSYQSNYI